MRALSFILGIIRLAILWPYNTIHFLSKTWVHLSFSTSRFSYGIEIVHFLMRHPYVWPIVLDSLLSLKWFVRGDIHSTRCIIFSYQWHLIYILLLIEAWILMILKIRFALNIWRLNIYWHSAFMIFFLRISLHSSLSESFDLVLPSRDP
jgi:hypothetical protein